MAFVALEASSKIDRFSGLPRGAPEFRRTLVRVTALFQAAGLLPGGPCEVQAWSLSIFFVDLGNQF